LQEKQLYEFGPFRLDPVKRRLLRDGEPVQLTPKAFETLLALVQQSGRTVEKDDLMRRVWPGSVVEENNLNQNITALRKCLGDSRQASRYIATIPGLGYRFVAEVRTAPSAEPDRPAGNGGTIRTAETTAVSLEHAATPAGAAANGAFPARVAPPAPPTPAPPLPTHAEPAPALPKTRRKAAAAFAALLLVGASAAVALWAYRRAGVPDRDGPNASEIEVTALTRTGTIGHAAISPDGRHIIYSVSEAGRASLWLRQAAASGAQQIVPPARADYLGLTFSRDGNHLYFVRAEMNGLARALYRLPTLGGVPTKLLDDVHSAVTLSPDGGRLAFVRNSKDESSLMVAGTEGGDARRLASRPITDLFKVPAWSPDGELIACSAGSGDRYYDNGVVAVRVADGEQRPASPRMWARTGWVEWLADGSGMLVTAREHPDDTDQVWHIAHEGGAARRVTGDSKRYLSISLTADSRTAAAVQTELNSDIWVAPEADAARAQKITFGSGSYLDVSYTPEGRIVYSSQAGGNWDIWVMNADGGGQRPLTADAGYNAQPSVSPDGRLIAFASSRAAGVFNIWRMDGDGGNPVRLSAGGGEKFPQWSPDGRWIVYNSVGPDERMYSLWRVSVEGGEPAQLTDGDCRRPSVSPDGARIACFHRDETAGGEYRVIVVPFAGGPPELTFPIPQDIVPLPFVRWSPDGQSITYPANRDGIANIWAQPLSGGLAKQLTDFKAEGRLRFDWSRDGKQLVLSRHVWTSDLVLLRNFGGKT